MSAKPKQHAWSEEALFNKALIYVGEMQRYTATDWRFGFWSSLSLELVARAALAHISPTLLANRSDWRNIYHALGHEPTAKQSPPVSVVTKDVFSIVRELLPEFTAELGDFCAIHCFRRNAELHSGEEVFEGLGTSEWLPKYYASCQILLQSMGKTLDDLFDDPQTAHDMIASLADTAAKAVAKGIAVSKEKWAQMELNEQRAAVAQAIAWATRRVGHRAKCPACGSPALIHGSSQGVVTTEIREDIIVQRQTMLPSSFVCIACGLKISGLSKLSACGLGNAFTSTSTMSPADFFGLHTEDELEQARREAAEAAVEEDFNE